MPLPTIPPKSDDFDLDELDTGIEFELSESQLAGQEKIVEWYNQCQEELKAKKKLSKPIFRLFGYAGTGKTTILSSTIQRLGNPATCFAAFTGKAALVMTKKGTPASTLHSLIYLYVEPDKDEIKALEDSIRNGTAGNITEAELELERISQPRFELNEKSRLLGAKLLAVDEVSMVNEELGNDVLSFGVPILVLGDPGQLPPIKGSGVWTQQEPDVMLTEIHRQAEMNPIVQFATRARQGIPLQFGIFYNEEDKEEFVIRTTIPRVEEDIYLQADQILCGKHITRKQANQKVRQILSQRGELELDGLNPFLPAPGDKLICLKNDKKRGLFNGQFAKVIEVGEVSAFGIALRLELETDDTSKKGYESIWYECLLAQFEDYEDREALKRVPFYQKKRHCEFDFGYCITVHKSQGSQWDSVLLLDDGFGKFPGGDRKKWLYTGLTRPAKQLIIAD